jgi:selenium metabolism protein YedF
MSKTILITSEFLGRGDDELGAKLMASFLRTLLTAEEKPDRIVFYNYGVKLLTEGTATSEILAELNKSGVQLIACGTCVGFFGLDDAIPKQHVSNMQEIVTLLVHSDNVVTV